MTEVLSRERVLHVHIGIAFGFSVLAVLLHNPVLFVIAIADMAVVLVSAPAAKAIADVWMAIGQLIGRVTSPLLFGVVYVLFLTPISFAYRSLHRNPLFLRKPADGTMYRAREHGYSPEDFEQIW